MSQWLRARANIDYHIAFDANLYGVPYYLVQELVKVRATPTTVTPPIWKKCSARRPTEIASGIALWLRGARWKL
jgi:hypothetical protein